MHHFGEAKGPRGGGLALGGSIEEANPEMTRFVQRAVILTGGHVVSVQDIGDDIEEQDCRREMVQVWQGGIS